MLRVAFHLQNGQGKSITCVLWKTKYLKFCLLVFKSMFVFEGLFLPSFCYFWPKMAPFRSLLKCWQAVPKAGRKCGSLNKEIQCFLTSIISFKLLWRSGRTMWKSFKANCKASFTSVWNQDLDPVNKYANSMWVLKHDLTILDWRPPLDSSLLNQVGKC